MDPIKQLSTPVTEVRAQASDVDECGERWVVIDGIETKVPSIKAAKALLVKQDALRVQIRAELDKTGIRDKTVKQTINIDGVETEVEMLPPSASGVFQIRNSEHDTREISDESIGNVATTGLYNRPGRFIPVSTAPPKRSPLFNLTKGARGQWYFIFNEGGRGVTLHIAPWWLCPFRLYVAGWVLRFTYGQGFSFKKAGGWNG